VKPDERGWYVIDAREHTLGRLASRVATVLRGKHKPTYSPHLDHGDHVVVINADKIRVTGRKLTDKTYFRYTGYIGGARTRTLEEMLARKPERVVELAVKGMLPKNRLGRSMFKKLKVYAGEKHPHAAQGPVRFPGHVG
jgi:large subunit ribosomal protein L13